MRITCKMAQKKIKNSEINFVFLNTETVSYIPSTCIGSDCSLIAVQKLKKYKKKEVMIHSNYFTIGNLNKTDRHVIVFFIYSCCMKLILIYKSVDNR